MSQLIQEAHLEEAVLELFADLGYECVHGPDVAPGESGQERVSFGDVVLVERLRRAIYALNPHIPPQAHDDAIRQVLTTTSPSLVEESQRLHRFLIEGVPVEYQGNGGRTIHDIVWLVDFQDPRRNDWVALNQLTVMEGQNHRRADIVVYLNGLPLGLIELKNPGDEKATTKGAYRQLQLYKKEIPSLLAYNEVLVASDGIEALAGTLTSDWERFLPWRTIDGVDLAPKGSLSLNVLIKGIFEPERFLDLIRYFIVFETDGHVIIKKMAGYHQFHAVNKAVACTVRATAEEGDRRVGVVWHTQGSGKSLSMGFYAGKIIQHPAMANPTLVVLTDRNDLDDQLYGNFFAWQCLLRQEPKKIESREDLREALKVASGGVIFTTIQKFLPEKGERFPVLSERRNIVVMADEAHRSQYGFTPKLKQDEEGAHLQQGYAQNVRDAMPNASFIGFTGTPIDARDKSTKGVFGDYIDVYDIQRAVEDGATVRIYYEARLARLKLKKEEQPLIDSEFEDITEGEEDTQKDKLKSRWARLEAMVGTETRIAQVAADIVQHFEQRLEVMDGKGMIVCMSRRICVDLYNAIIKLRPQWHSPDDDKGFLKVVMTGSAFDPEEWQPHIRNKSRRDGLAKRIKDPKDSFKLVIVRDMWLTGFDAPCMHTMYVDKPMGGHNLMQAIARVNRVFKDKPGALVVDYLGIAELLKQALSAYTEGDRREAGVPQDQAAAVMTEKYEIGMGILHGFDLSRFDHWTPKERLDNLAQMMEHVASQKDGIKRFVKAVGDLSKAYALAVPHEDALALRDRVAYFQAVRAAFLKNTAVCGGPTMEDLDAAVRQLVSQAVSSGEVLDVFASTGMARPEISLLSDEFLEEVKKLPQRNLALELLRKLINDEIKSRGKKNRVQARSFSEMLEQAILQYQNRTIDAAQVIAELIELAKQMRAARERGESLGLSEDEEAFYDALGVNDSAVQVLGDETLKAIARDLAATIRKNVTIDWTSREAVRAKLRVLVKRLLNKYGYPPDRQALATLTVLEQAELVAKDWACC